MRMRKLVTFALASLAIAGVGASWFSNADAARRYRDRTYGSDYRYDRGYYDTEVIPAGANLVVRLDQTISTSEANRGNTWTGTIVEPVYSDNRLMIPEGTPVSGVITSVRQGTSSNRPMLALAIRRISIDGRNYALNADTEPIVAGSKRAQKIGAIIGGAAVGGLLGKAIGGTKGAIIGGVAGGAGTYGLTRHRFRTMHLDEGTEISFTTRHALVARL